MTLRLWIDDIHAPLDDTWSWAKTVDEALAHLNSLVRVECVSFDHDLGYWDTKRNKYADSIPIAEWFEAQAENGNLLIMPKWYVHSGNPRGRQDLTAVMQRAERFIAERSAEIQPSIGAWVYARQLSDTRYKAPDNDYVLLLVNGIWQEATWREDEWHDVDDNVILASITAWAPLPKTPEEIS